MTDDTQSQPITALNDALATGFETADFAALQTLYAEDSVLLPPRSRPIRGSAAIAAFWAGVRNRFAGMTFTTGEFKALGSEVARETGTFDMAAGEGGGLRTSGKYLIVWQKTDGGWRVESSIWSRNPDQPQRQAGQGAPQGQRGPAQGQRQGGQGGGAQAGNRPGGGYRQGGGQQGGAPGRYRQTGYGGGGGRGRGGIGGQQGGIGAGGSGLGGAGRRANPQQGARRGQGGPGAQGGGGGQSLYDDNMGLYSNRDD